MKIVLLSMPDVAPVIMHESAFHMPNLGIASIGANLPDRHEVYLIDLIRKRRQLRRYLMRTLRRVRPQLIGISAMTWQYATSLKIIALAKRLLPEVKIVLGGYHATLMYQEIGASPEAYQIDFLIRGEGEAAFKGLISALEGKARLAAIASLSFRQDGHFVHNPQGELLDLAGLKLPIRDKRRLTRGYHIMNRHCEVMETSRGCTRTCNFCSIRHMYGRAFRPFPIERILADIDDIYYGRHVRWIFVSDDNMVLDPDRVITMCKAIIARGYRNLHFVVQADCVTMARNEPMVRMMAKAGFKSVFLGIENASTQNLAVARKGNTPDYSRRAVALCHKYGIMVVGGMIFGFPDDEEADIVANYRFLKSTGADTAYCQILTPYPKTGIREELTAAGLVTNPDDFTRYNGMWANVRTRHLSSERLHYLCWYHRLNVMGWWEPSERIRRQGRLWTSIWRFAFRPLMKRVVARAQKKYGWKGRYRREVARIESINRFSDLDSPG
jgi:anaerobic magnesium-protoporphyrin IX monomethyl ester cyclase